MSWAPARGDCGNRWTTGISPRTKTSPHSQSGKPVFVSSRKCRGAVEPVALFWCSVWGDLLLANLYCPLVVLIFWTDCNFSFFYFLKLFVLHWSVGDEQCCDSFEGTAKGPSHTHTCIRSAPRIQARCKTVLRAVQ